MKISEIAKLMCRDKSTIRSVLHKNNLFIDSTNYITDSEWNNIVADYQNGMSIKNLSIKYKRSDGYIINKLKKEGIFKYITNRLSNKDWSEVIELYKQGKNDEIFLKYPSLSISSLYSKMSKLKIKSGLRNYWSEEDKDFIKNNYFTYDTNVLCDMIDNRHTKDAIIDLAFHEFGYSKSRIWTQEEYDIIMDNYSKMTARELQTLLPNRSIQAIREMGIKNGLKSKYRDITYWKDDETDYLLDHWNMESDYEIGKQLNKTASSVKDRRNLLGLYRINKNKQGYTSIKQMLRGQIWNWKKESIKACDYKCVLTGSKDFHIHHLYSFTDIFNEYLDIHSIKKLDIAAYDESELTEICSSFVEFHDKYPLGVCIRPDLHSLFHTQYGQCHNTIEQWEKFFNTYKPITK